MGMEKIVLIANPGSASRKYAVYKGDSLLCSLHFEFVDNSVVYSFKTPDSSGTKKVHISHVAFAATTLIDILNDLIDPAYIQNIVGIALRVVAPSSFFQSDHLLTRKVLKKLSVMRKRAPLHIDATLAEYHLLSKIFDTVPIFGISDSAFHKNRLDVAQLYALPKQDSKKYDIKRFGYHGLSLESAMMQLRTMATVEKRVIICHLGSGASIAAVRDGRCLDSTMGYSPLEGVMMAARSGNIDYVAADNLRESLKLTPLKFQQYLNSSSGLYGVSGTSSDIRILLEKEKSGDFDAQYALAMYVYRIQKGIGEMAAVLGGVDQLVFTGTVGERASKIRNRICSNLMYLGLIIDHVKNSQYEDGFVDISTKSSPSTMVIVPANENVVMAHKVNNLFDK